MATIVYFEDISKRLLPALIIPDYHRQKLY